ncbi:LacI family DNA-binding transcriptional regulator [Zobellia sp. 1_MG-2023]|uniref:LacI family DNA-binding transcriptional regulator n=1 Tax=Zobellia sp. 1_MG-2023 TaxID=3062626 RepID=UPI0026E2A16E|nr:LacI family DNA-binding transcriptional regulator [Zobellia sp. 1_MG-2023]MDO6817716.1 LacI family DNA-binding transcriptional regulator [Zobellia sp. 1_MG-2023]
MKRKITLKQIAKELEVSISTVSKALKDSDEISADTKQKVKAFAKLYNYRPNTIALSLKNRKTKNIGVVIPDIVHHFFTTVFRGIEKCANEHGYNVVVCVSDESYDKEVFNMELLANGSIDGFIMSVSAETQQKNDFSHLKEVMEQGFPLVLFDRVIDEIKCDKVVMNDEQIAYDATVKMLAEGKKKIALVTTESYFNVSEKRAEGYKRALLDHNIAHDEKLTLVLPFKGIEESYIENFVENESFDGVLCVNEIFAVLFMGAAQKKGLKIPEDVSVIGFTDGLLSRYSSPTLTTVAQHGEKMGERAAEMLIEKLENEIGFDEEEVYKTEVIEATLLERGSTINK